MLYVPTTYIGNTYYSSWHTKETFYLDMPTMRSKSFEENVFSLFFFSQFTYHTHKWEEVSSQHYVLTFENALKFEFLIKIVLIIMSLSDFGDNMTFY